MWVEGRKREACGMLYIIVPRLKTNSVRCTAIAILFTHFEGVGTGFA
jgi:hypothetical protein